MIFLTNINKFFSKKILIRYNSFILFSIITFTWAIFFAMYKFFLWWELVNNWLDINLQNISAYLSLWWIPAYLIWSAIAYTFLKRYILFLTAFITSFIVFISYIFPISSDLYFLIVVSFVWFIYWIWSVFKNILIAIEIEKTGLKDTFVNGLISTFFIVALIIWTIWWNLLYEKLSSSWYIAIIILLLFTSIISFFLDYDWIKLKLLLNKGYKNYFNSKKESFKDSFKEFLPDLKYVYIHYQPLIISSALLWSISTIMSQKAIEYSIETFVMTNSSASMLLLYSAWWAVLWNILSMKFERYRWNSFYICLILFWIILLSFPFIAVKYTYLIMLSIWLWLVFWMMSNLLDWYFFRQIWKDNKKESWASVFWLVLSINIFWMMNLANYIQDNLWLLELMIMFNIILFIIWIILYKNLKKHKK